VNWFETHETPEEVGTMAHRIMIIDDDQDIRTYLKTLFEKNGYDTETAEDGEKGFLKAKAFQPSLITLDILMPKESGMRLFKKLKEDAILKDVPVVILTGVSQYRELHESGFPPSQLPAAFIEKPIRQEEILKTVRELIP
jgi:twitching motility two-component system response regulator PilH